jgi:N,N'-diacetyllegionaminate synthase
MDTRAIARRSLVAARAIGEGKTLQSEDITARRPGTGLSPMETWEIIGRDTTHSISSGFAISKDQLITDQEAKK